MKIAELNPHLTPEEYQKLLDAEGIGITMRHLHKRLECNLQGLENMIKKGEVFQVKDWAYGELANSAGMKCLFNEIEERLIKQIGKEYK